MLVQTPRKPACRIPPDCSAEQRADTDPQTRGYGSASKVLQDLECIWVQARARQKTQVVVIYTRHASKPSYSRGNIVHVLKLLVKTFIHQLVKYTVVLPNSLLYKFPLAAITVQKQLSFHTRTLLSTKQYSLNSSNTMRITQN